MKNLSALAATLAFTIISFSQTTNGFGLKAGLNYSANGNYFDAVQNAAEHPDRNIGYHLGIFGKVGNHVYLRPELIFSKTKSDYRDSSFELSKLDAPILLGFNLLGPLSVFAGPSLQYIIDAEFDTISINNFENEFTVGLNFGIGINLDKIGIDLRYERGFNSNEASFLQNNTILINDRIDSRPDQLILSISLLL